MANGNRLSMSYGRRFTAIALAALGLFVVSYGIGFGNPGIMAVGLAVGILGPALLILTAVRATGRQYIYGTAHVYSASPPPSSGMVGRCELHLSVFAAGIDGVAVRVLDPAVPVSKWPDDGATLPVEVVANNPRKVRVLWDKVVTHAQAAGEDLYPQYVEDLPSDLDEEFDDDLPGDEFLDEEIEPVRVGPPPTPPPNMPTGSTATIAEASIDFAPVPAPVLVPPAAAPPPGAPTTKVVAASVPVEAVGESSTASTFEDQDDAREHRRIPTRAERDRQNRAFVSETYDPDDDEIHEYWREPDDPDEPESPPATAARNEPVSPAGPSALHPHHPLGLIADPDDDTDDDTDRPDGPGGQGGPGGPGSAGGPGGPRGSGGGSGWGSRRGATADDDSPAAMAAGAGGGPAVSLPLPRRRPSPHLRRPSPRQRKAADSETGEARATASGGINPVYVAEAPSEPPPDWPLRPEPVASTPAPAPMRPESWAEPDHTEVVSGTVEAGPNGYGEVLTGSIVDDHAYSDRSETDRMTFDRSSFRALEIDVPEIGPNGHGGARSGQQQDDADEDPFNVVPLRVDQDRGAHASNGTGAGTDNPPAADGPAGDADPAPDDDSDDVDVAFPDETAPDDGPARSETSTTDAADQDEDESEDDGEPSDDAFSAEAGSFLAAPSAGLSKLGTGGFSLTLFVRELTRSVAFYRDTLGLTEVDIGKGSAVLARGDSRILLKRVVDLQPVDRRIVHLNLEVPDVQAAYQELKDKGVEFVHRPRVVSHGEQLELWAATFRDPDGHAIALTHWELRR